MASRLTSNAARFAAQAGRAAVAQAIAAGRTAGSIGIAAARETARVTSYIEPTIVLTASDAGDGTATIAIAAHRRVYPVQGSIKVADVEIEAHDLTGAPLASAGLTVYYIDGTLADPTPAFLFTDNDADAQVGITGGMHLVGKVPTPAAGAADTTGDAGAAPPGYGHDIDTRSTL